MPRNAKKCQEMPKGGDGNTDSSPPIILNDNNAKYRYCFTLNNYKKANIPKFKDILNENCKKWIFGYEIGESGTPHLQGSIWLFKKHKITELKKIFLNDTIHFETMRNETASLAYCQKDGDFESKGFPQKIKIIKSLFTHQENILNIYKTEPDDRKIYWIYDAIGNTGKSAFVKFMFVNYKVAVINSGKLSDVINIIFNIYDENGSSFNPDCRAIFIDVPRDNGNKISYSAVEAIKNGLVVNTKYETGAIAFNVPHVFIFSNSLPEFSKFSSDRWEIINW